MSDSSDIFTASGVEAPEQPAPGSEQPYRVLARKYRPARFDQLIGQDAMVQTLGNAIKRDRLAHAFLMTGVRGVGKTTTARLIAKALNCIGEDGQGGPTIDPCGKCEPCTSIAVGSFIDVIEMDAASHTGVDDVREIIEAVRYSSVSARYKIYIIDEVHMLSKNAFNALLKTLEEPPAHVKFIFATTEVNKVPITVLSRCQRFDLKRITPALLAENFRMICNNEDVEADDDALNLIAQAAEGSARDGQSILDQAISHADLEGDGRVTATQIREMLGLSDRGAIRRLFGQLLAGDQDALLTSVEEQHKIGVEPLSIMNGLLSLSHQVTLFKVGRVTDPTLSEEAKVQFESWSKQLSYPVLHRLWQLLLKGFEEVQRAHLPREACDMALLRILCAADMPDPGKLAELLKSDTSSSQPGTDNPPAPPAAVEPVSLLEQPEVSPNSIDRTEPGLSNMPESFEAVVTIVGQVSPILESILIADMRVVKFEAPVIEYQSARAISDTDIRKIADALRLKTAVLWEIREGEGEAIPSIAEQAQQAYEAKQQAILDTPLVKAAMEAFPDAELLDDEQSSEPQTRSA
ncbi:MAG: DNA polymerase III subunit gamma/tau [Parasphingorhabdus sp.]